ncbi:MAG: glutamine amidotransferase, partial [Spirochaetia bacterium]
MTGGGEGARGSAQGSARGSAARILVLKLGDTLPALKARKGDFEDWIVAGLGVAREEVRVVDVPRGDPLPDASEQKGIIITGSESMVTERLEWSERAAEWLRNAVGRGPAVLGICYGHQLLAHALGGVVGNNPKGEELGAVDVALEGTARDDALLGGLPTRVRVYESHAQSVLKLPQGAVRLASNPWDANQAFRYGAAAWGVQFHPEFDAEVAQAYIEHHRADLAAGGRDPDELLRAASRDALGGKLLRKFALLAL